MKNELDPVTTAANWLMFLAMLWRLSILAMSGLIGLWGTLGCLIYFGIYLHDMSAALASVSGCMAAGFLMFKEALK